MPAVKDSFVNRAWDALTPRRYAVRVRGVRLAWVNPRVGEEAGSRSPVQRARLAAALVGTLCIYLLGYVQTLVVLNAAGGSKDALVMGVLIALLIGVVGMPACVGWFLLAVLGEPVEGGGG